MRTFLAVLVVMFMATGAWAGLGLPNELADPGFEQGDVWQVSGGGGLLTDQISHAFLQSYGVPALPGGGTYCGGVATLNASYPGGQLRQVVDESLFPGWDPDLNAKIVEVDFWYFQLGQADVPMNIDIYLDWMEDGSDPTDPGAPGYVKQWIGNVTNVNSAGWQYAEITVELPVQPQYLSVEFDFTYFSGMGLNVIDNADLQGLCIPEPGGLFALGTGLIGLVGVLRRRR